uniref:Cytochrome P450 n=1 Tax=Trichuris muris TaxID=70415 RepID=A0A5S6QND9_TRIMR
MLLCLTAIFAAITIWTLWVLLERNQFWKKRGICGPEPELLYGNLRELRSGATKHETIRKWTEKYGKVYGFMEGGIPVLVISDLEMLHDIFIKKFSSFHARKRTYLDVHALGPKRLHMFVASGSRWKRLRAISAPAFTTIRLKQMSSSMNACIDGLVQQMEAKSSKESVVDVYELFQQLTLNVISRCAFGFVPTSSQSKEDDFLSLCAKTFADAIEDNWIFTCTKVLPAFRYLWSKIYFTIYALFGLPFLRLDRMFRCIVKAREEECETRMDICKGNSALIDILIEHKVKDGDVVDEDAMLQDEVLEDGLITKKIFREEVVSQCVLYMLAGYETTSNALSYVIYELARHPEVQNKLRKEIMDCQDSEDEKPSFETVQRMAYLDCVIRETLRLYPVASWVVSRMCSQTCTVGGITIEKGMMILADVWSIHYDKDVWGADADEFVPERFAEDQLHSLHPLAWIPFGAGPRHCIGDRFAMLEMKLALARLVRKYQIFPNAQTEIPLELREGVTNTPRNGVLLSFKLA